MSGQQPFDCLDLDDQLSLDDKVESVATIELDTLVPDRELELSFEAQPTKTALVSQALLVRRLE